MSTEQLTRPLVSVAHGVVAAALAALSVCFVPDTDARITKIVLNPPTPAYGGVSFGSVGPYEQITGVAYGEVDPNNPLDAVIQDIGLAPLAANGKVQYSTQIVILRPVNLANGNQTVLAEIVNRGNMLNHGYFNVGVTKALPQGDGFLENQGFTMVWAGWQADLVPPAVVTMFPAGSGVPLPIAHYPNEDDPVRGPVRSEFTVTTPTSTRPILDESSSNTPGYATASLDNSGDTMTMRVHQNDPKVPIANSDWAYADCTVMPFPGVRNRQKVCLRNGFDTNHIYELLYTARDPIVMGLGLAALRDLGSFLKYSATDDVGNPNPLAGGAIKFALVNGISQSGRFLRTFLELGFNEDEMQRQVFDGAQPHIGAVRNYFNVRFAQPGRLAGTQHTEQQYPGPEGPLTYGDSFDKFTGQTSGLLDRCTQTRTCPLIIHTMSDIEYWESSAAFDTVLPDGSADAAIPDNVRIYQFSSTQHAGFSPVGPLPTPATPVPPTQLWICEQLPNANSYTYNIRALLVALQQWVATGQQPPPSRYSTLANHSLVAPAAVAFPVIPCMAGLSCGPDGKAANVTGPNTQGGVWDTRTVWDRGRHYNATDVSGIISNEPPIAVAQYPSLVPQVDADGNDIDGLRSVTLRAPLGTYAGWNVRKMGYSQGDACDLNGQYIPFAGTRADRIKTGDSRLSLQERYGNAAVYLQKATAAADALVSQGLLLKADTQSAINCAVNQAAQAAQLAVQQGSALTWGSPVPLPPCPAPPQ